MKEKYYELSGKEIPEGSDIDIRMKVLAGEIFDSEVNLDFIKRQMFASTATGSYIDKHAKDRGLKRNPAVKATGEVTFSVNTARDESILIPQGTIVGTSGDNCIRFVTDISATLYAGLLSRTVPCSAEIAGYEGNVSSGSVDVIITNVLGIDSVTNRSSFSGGSDAESDESLRNRVLNTYVSVSNGTNAAYYIKLAETVDGVKSANVIPRARGTGTVDVYLEGYNAEVSETVVNDVQRIMDEQRELNVDVRVRAATALPISLGFVIMLKDGYELNDVADNIRAALYNYMNSLRIGDDVLEAYLGHIILSVDGVYDYYWMINYSSSFTINNNEFAVFNSAYIEESTW